MRSLSTRRGDIGSGGGPAPSARRTRQTPDSPAATGAPTERGGARRREDCVASREGRGLDVRMWSAGRDEGMAVDRIRTPIRRKAVESRCGSPVCNIVRGWSGGAGGPGGRPDNRRRTDPLPGGSEDRRGFEGEGIFGHEGGGLGSGVDG